jgi:hypothetical protein
MHLLLTEQQIETIRDVLLSNRSWHPVYGDIASTIMTQLNDFKSDDRAKIVAEAKAEYSEDGRIEIDDNAILSRSEEGAYVQAWVWVGNED